MTVPSGTFQTYSAKGNREDLSDVIYNIDPVDTPVMNSIDRTDATAVLHEWQIDSLASASSSNAVVEGDDATVDSVTATTRLSNTCQISDKVRSISGTQEAVRKAGRRSELGYQMAKSGQELKRDMETIICANTAEVTGDATTARKLGAIPAWIKTNADTAGTAGQLGNTAAVNGTQRDFTEAILKNVLLLTWNSGGDPDLISVGGFNKQTASTFTGNSTRYKSAEDSVLNAAIDLYESDFGDLEIVPNRFQRARDALVLQKNMWAVAYLRSFTINDLAKTGDSTKKQLLAEYTLESRNEKASGIALDLTTS